MILRNRVALWLAKKPVSSLGFRKILGLGMEKQIALWLCEQRQGDQRLVNAIRNFSLRQ